MTMVLLEIAAKPESVESLKDIFKVRLPETRAYEGCQSITVFLNDDGRTFVGVEHWDSREHYDKYLAWRTETGVMAEVESLLDAEPSIRYFDTVDA